MKKLMQAMLAAVFWTAVIVTSPIGSGSALAQDDGGDDSGSDNGDGNEDSQDDDKGSDDSGGSAGEGGGSGSGGRSGGETETETETEDDDHDFALKGVKAGRLFSLKVILKAARAQLGPGERILDVNLKQRRATPHYEVTILGQSGTLRTVRFQALRPSKSKN